MPSPLDDAYFQVERGSEHLAELETLYGEVRDATIRGSTIEFEKGLIIQPNTPTRLMQVHCEHAPIPKKLKSLVGESANAFRAALNYLITELAVLHKVPKTRNPQFPIEDSPEKFTKYVRKSLKGFSAPHIAAIQKLQPCEGCDWTKCLRRLSNVHKHSKLVLIEHDSEVILEFGEPVDDPANPGSLIRPMNVQFKPTLTISLGDGLPVVETLEVIKTQVAYTLDAFNPEFDALHADNS
jgi:hypothetical protein